MLVEICVLFLIASTKDKSYNKNNKIQVRASEWQIKKQLAKKKFLKQKKQEEYNRKKIADFMEMLPVEKSIKLEQNQQYFFDNIENYGTQRTMVEGYQKK
ncbi:hypothetical protein [Enterococcus cecorum]|uniref:hypothetical protein n=1 Tax=Enterococcus cecorum TaxID=44008 RepID=UPI001364A62E|nr:hypothetical protein [Enterococcus cecorum]